MLSSRFHSISGRAVDASRLGGVNSLSRARSTPKRGGVLGDEHNNKEWQWQQGEQGDNEVVLYLLFLLLCHLACLTYNWTSSTSTTEPAS